MQVSDEMIRVAHAEYHKVLGDKNRSDPMRAALTVALALSGWRTIDSAPKDGSRFLGGHFDTCNGDFRQFVCFWNPGWKGCEGVNDSGPFWQGGGLLEHPIHWQPLPAPPAGKEEAE